MKPFYWTGWFLSRMLGIFGFHWKVLGREHVPKEGGCILAPNHRSHFDPPLVGSALSRQVYFLAKKELFGVPVLGWLIRRTNALPIKRGAIDRAAVQSCLEALHNGRLLTVFPEGTRSKSNEFLSPKPGIGVIARKAGVPIVPVYVENSNDLKSCLLFKRRLRITYGEPIMREKVMSYRDEKEGYLALAADVMARIVALRDRSGS